MQIVFAYHLKFCFISQISVHSLWYVCVHHDGTNSGSDGRVVVLGSKSR